MQNQYWQHKTNGEIYAVQVDGDTIISACGPLHYSEVTQDNLHPWGFDSDPELVADLDADYESYKLYEGPEKLGEQ